MAPHHPSPNVTCSFFLRLCSEVPILEDTLMRILVIGLSRELPLGPADAMELADHLVKRAAAVQADGNSLAPCPSPSLSLGVLPPAEPVSCLSCCGTSHTHTPPGAVPVSCPTSFQLPWGGLGQTRKPRYLWISDVEVLKVERIQLIDAVLNLCTYHHPENIQLPPG